MDFRTALFLAALPYRRGLYRGRILQNSGGPGAESFEKLLNIYYRRTELERAMRTADEFLNRKRSDSGIQFVSLWDETYPPYLREIYDPPPILFCTGSRIPHGSGFAIVGTRHPANISILAVHRLVREIQSERFPRPIVSGFALGIDRAAHFAAIQCGLATVAVLGSGVLCPGPSSNLSIIDLAKEREAALTLVSEFVPDMPPAPHHFPRRNRIIAGLCSRLYLIQAPERSGALISARYALDEGREVIAFDHDLLTPGGLNEGARSLIRDGAHRLELSGMRLIREPPYQNRPEAEQLEFWKKRASGGLVRVGQDLYVERDFFP